MHHPGKNWVHDFLPYMLYRLSSKMRQDVKRKISKHGLNNTSWRILAVLDSEGACSITDLTKITVMEQPTISRLIDKLEANELVKRVAATSDSRKQNISLSNKGKDLVTQIIPEAFSNEDIALSNFSTLEIKSLKSYLRRLGENIDLDGF
jgi:MarR family transcriptional regulator, organic hydroperoxide resistance regulator